MHSSCGRIAETNATAINPKYSYKKIINEARYSHKVYPKGPSIRTDIGIIIAKDNMGTKNTLIDLGDILFKYFSRVPKNRTTSIAGKT